MPESESNTVLASAAINVRVPQGTTPASLEPLVQQVFAMLVQQGFEPISGLVISKGHSTIRVVPPQE